MLLHVGGSSAVLLPRRRRTPPHHGTLNMLIVWRRRSDEGRVQMAGRRVSAAPPQGRSAPSKYTPRPRGGATRPRPLSHGAAAVASHCGSALLQPERFSRVLPESPSLKLFSRPPHVATATAQSLGHPESRTCSELSMDLS